MAKRRIPHGLPREQFSALEDTAASLTHAQAAAWLLDQLHVGALAKRQTLPSSVSFDSPLADKAVRNTATWIALQVLAENLADAQKTLAEAAAPKAVA